MLGILGCTTYVPKINAQNWRRVELYVTPNPKNPKKCIRGATPFQIIKNKEPIIQS
jgi:hypothetical protein